MNAAADELPNPFGGVKPTRAPRLPSKPVTPPPNRLKHGGRAHSDAAEDREMIHEMVKPKALKRKDGGKVMNPWMTAGRGSGEGSLQTARATKRKSGLKPIMG